MCQLVSVDQPEPEHFMYLQSTVVEKWMLKSAAGESLLSTEYEREVGGSYSSGLRPELTSAALTYSLGHDSGPLYSLFSFPIQYFDRARSSLGCSF